MESTSPTKPPASSSGQPPPQPPPNTTTTTSTAPGVAQPPKKTVVGIGRKIGTLSSSLGNRATDERRLQTLRQNDPDKTLGGVRKREFVPNIIAQPPKRRPTEDSDLDSMLPGPIPELLKTSVETIDQSKEKLLNQQQQKKRETRKKVTFGAPNPVNTAASPFAAGPPQQDKHKKSSVGKVVEEEPQEFEPRTETGFKDKGMEIDPFNPSHPAVLPYPERAHIIKEEAPVEAFGRLSTFLKDNEMCFMQLPSSLPVIAPMEPEETKSEKKQETGLGGSEHEFMSNLTKLPEGYLGKLVVYKSGKIKMKVGDFVYDIEPGAESVFLQQIMLISQESKQCYQLGNLSKRYTCIPDLSSLL